MSEHMMMNQGNMPTSFTDIFSGNAMFSFDDINAAAFQAMSVDHHDIFSAPSHEIPMDCQQQEVLLSSILAPPPMDETEEEEEEDRAQEVDQLLSCDFSSSEDSKKSTCRTREWKLIHCAEDLKHALHEDTVKIAIKTRDDKQANYHVPDKLYSSLRYVLSQKLDSSFLANKQTVLMSKIQIVNPQTQEEIRKKNNEYVIDKGNTMVELKYNADTKCYECTEKIKFLDNSYRHNDIKFAFKVSFYDASQPAFLTKSPILELLSAAFHVRARRPPKNKRDEEDEKLSSPVQSASATSGLKNKNSKKRKLDAIDDEVEDVRKKTKLSIKTPSPSPQITVAQPSPTSSKRIMGMLGKLAFYINTLPETERTPAFDLAKRGLGTFEFLRQPIPLEAFPMAAPVQPGSENDINTSYSADDLLSFDKFL